MFLPISPSSKKEAKDGDDALSLFIALPLILLILHLLLLVSFALHPHLRQLKVSAPSFCILFFFRFFAYSMFVFFCIFVDISSNVFIALLGQPSLSIPIFQPFHVHVRVFPDRKIKCNIASPRLNCVVNANYLLFHSALCGKCRKNGEGKSRRRSRSSGKRTQTVVCFFFRMTRTWDVQLLAISGRKNV